MAKARKVKCHANRCGEQATETITNGTFRHPLKLNQEGADLLKVGSRCPLCPSCYVAATSGPLGIAVVEIEPPKIGVAR